MCEHTWTWFRFWYWTCDGIMCQYYLEYSEFEYKFNILFFSYSNFVAFFDTISSCGYIWWNAPWWILWSCDIGFPKMHYLISQSNVFTAPWNPSQRPINGTFMFEELCTFWSNKGKCLTHPEGDLLHLSSSKVFFWYCAANSVGQFCDNFHSDAQSFISAWACHMIEKSSRQYPRETPS